MKLARLGQFFMYIVAALFLGYHLMPVFSVVMAQLDVRARQEAEYTRIADSATCTDADSKYPQLTFGNPMTEPLYNDVPYVDPDIQPVIGTNLILNNSFATQTDGWENNRYGANTASFSLVEGYDGSPAARVQIANRKDGDAKWQTQAIDAQPGQYFRLEHWFKTDSYTDVTVDVIQQDGGHIYLPLGKTEPTNGKWKRGSYDFVAPAFTGKVVFSNTLHDNGTLDVDQWKVVSQPLPRFKRGLVSLTFDDGWKSIYTNGSPLFDKYHIKTTQFIVSDTVGDSAYMTKSNITALAKNGHEIASHTRLHEDLSRLNSQTILRTLAGSRAVLNDFYNWPVNNFASPYGSTNELSRTLIKQCYQSHRGTDTGFNTPTYDRYNVKVFNVGLHTKPEEISTAVRFARDHRLWLVMVYHEVSNDTTSDYAATLKDLEKTLQILQEEQVPVVTFQQGLTETIPQQEAFYAVQNESVRLKSSSLR